MGSSHVCMHLRQGMVSGLGAKRDRKGYNRSCLPHCAGGWMFSAGLWVLRGLRGRLFSSIMRPLFS
jgi:hypothetical protein